jgi:Icc-related predicted phosphoesterase
MMNMSVLKKHSILKRRIIKMKIAALYDIHGNFPALKAVLDELETIQPDLIVIGGDIVSGPMPVQTLDCLH